MADNQPQYTPEQIQQALQAGVISQDDANFLMKQIDPGTGWGAIAGAGLGALAGGAAGAMGGQRLGKGIASKFGGDAAQDASGFGQKMARGMGQDYGITGLSPENILSKPSGNPMGMGLGAAGAVGGGFGGAELGSMMDGPGSTGSDERDQLLQALMDPRTSPEAKQQIMQLLEQMNAEGQQGGGQDSQIPPGSSPVMDGALTGAGWGGLGGAGAGAIGFGIDGAMHSGPGAFHKMGAAGALGGMGALAGGAIGALGGAGIGAGIGALSGPPADPRAKFRDPLAQGQ